MIENPESFVLGGADPTGGEGGINSGLENLRDDEVLGFANGVDH